MSGSSESGDRSVSADGGLNAAAVEVDGSSAFEPTTPALDPDTVFHTLSNERRRHALHYLKRHDGPVTLRDMSRTIAAWENGIEPKQVTPAERKRVYTALYQNHLPQMDRIGVVDYDQDRGTISLTDAVEAFDVYLEVVPRRELSWGEFYLGFSAVALTLVVLQALAFPPFGFLSGTLLAGGIALVLAGASAVQVARKRSMRVGNTALPQDVVTRAEGDRVDEERIA